MDIRELKELVKEYHLCEHKVESSSIDSVVSKFKQVEILKTLEKYSTYFLTTAKTFEENLKLYFEQKQNINRKNISLQSQIKSFEFNDEKHSFAYLIKPSIQIKSNNEIRNRKLPEFIILSKNELTDNNFLKNEFEISLLPFLIKTTPQTNSIVHLSCWDIVYNNLFREYSIN